MKEERRQKGNMLVLVSVTVAILCLIFLIVMSFGGLFFEESRLRTNADEIALAGARKLNDMDRIGQMNNMIARCRALVFVSRKDLLEVKEKFPAIETLTRDLLDESRSAAEDLETARQFLDKQSKKEAIDAMEAKFNSIKQGYAMTLPWLKVKTPELQLKKFGRIKDVECNATILPFLDELNNGDQAQGRFANRPGLKLYKQGIDARLPGSDDSDLVFKLSSLPPIVNKTISPARCVQPTDFVEDNNQLASACLVKIRLSTSTGVGPEGSGDMGVTAAAASTGACDQQ